MSAATFTAANCAAQAGAAIAENCLNSMFDLNDQTDRANLLAAALIGLSTLAHHEHAAAGFAGAMVAMVERRRKPECESQIDSEAMQAEVGRMLTDSMNRQKRIRYARNEDACPDCGTPTTFLNIERDHYEVCHGCKQYSHFGENLHSGWRNETPEIWAANQKTLDGYTEFDVVPAPQPMSDAELFDLPF